MLEKQRKKEEAEKFADEAKFEIDNLQTQMQQTAEIESRNLYKNYNLVGCTPKPIRMKVNPKSELFL